MGKWDFTRCVLKMSFGRVSYIAQPPWFFVWLFSYLLSDFRSNNLKFDEYGTDVTGDRLKPHNRKWI